MKKTIGQLALLVLGAAILLNYLAAGMSPAFAMPLAALTPSTEPPTRTSTRPLISSEMIASRTDVRLTPSDAASSRSAGSREPAGNSPLAISCAS